MILSAFAALCLQLPQEKRDPIVQKEIGFVRVIFFADKGTVTVILPEEICSGDAISGSAFSNSKDFTLDKLQLDLGNAHATFGDPAGPRRSWIVPKTEEPRMSFTAWTTDGKLLGTTYLSIASLKPRPDVYTIPFFARIGSPFLIKGPFNGDASDSAIKANDIQIPVVAESPRAAVALLPSQTLPGEGTIDVGEEGMHAKAACRFLSVNMTAPKTSLSKGEQTELKIAVEGIQGLAPDKAPMIIVENLTPKTIDLGGKVKHFLLAKPSKDGDFSYSLTVTSILAGSFSVSALVDPGVGTKVSPTKN